MNRFIDSSHKTNKSQIIQSKHSKPICNAIFIEDSAFMLTLGEDGQINLYKKQSQKYNHARTLKIFSSPIISFDLIKEWGDWKIVLLSFTAQLALCKLNFQGQFIVFNRSKIITESQSEVVTSCCWSSKRNEVLFTTSLGKIFIDQPSLNIQHIQISQKVTGAKLVRSGSNIYVSGESQIFKVVFLENIQLKKIIESSYFKEKVRILDYLVSEGQCMNFIIVLTQQKLFFFVSEELSAKPQIVEVPVKAITGKLSWGRSYHQLGLSLPFKQGSKVFHYSCSMNGIWSQQPQYQ